jgi:hypothetical protein
MHRRLAKEKSSSKQINQLLIWSYDLGTLRISCFVTVTTVTEQHPKTDCQPKDKYWSQHSSPGNSENRNLFCTWHLASWPYDYASNLYFKGDRFEFGRDIDYTDSSFRGISQVNTGKQPQKLGHDHVLPHPFQFIIHYHIAIRRYIVWRLLMSLNKERIHTVHDIRLYYSPEIPIGNVFLFRNCLQTGTVKYSQ